MKLKYKCFETQDLITALQRLSDHSFRDIKFSYKIAKIVRTWDKELGVYRELWRKVIKEYAAVDEKGQLLPLKVTQPDGSVVEDASKVHIPEENKEKFNKAMDDLMNLEFEIQVTPIHVEDLDGVPLTAQELLGLEPIITAESLKALDQYVSSASESSAVSDSAA